MSTDTKPADVIVDDGTTTLSIEGFPPEVAQTGVEPPPAERDSSAYLKTAGHLIAADGNWARRTSWPEGTRVVYGAGTALMHSAHADPHPWNSDDSDVFATDWETGSPE